MPRRRSVARRLKARQASGRSGNGRYWEHVIDDEHDLERHVDYIHYNPVKHGLVRCPRDWQYSSFVRFVRSGVYPADWACGSQPPLDFADLDETAMELIISNGHGQ